MRHLSAPPILPTLALFATVWIAPTAGASALDLDAYFEAAVARSEVVATQHELIRQAEERYQQARAARLPLVEGFASYVRQDTPNRALGGAASVTRQPLAGIGATQPLFRGFREVAALRQSEALIGAQRSDYAQARLQLYKDVAQNFYTVLSLEQELANLNEEIAQNQRREEEIRARVRIGRSRAAEVLTVQSAISTLRAEAEQLGRELAAAREAFAFLSGLDPATPLRDAGGDPPALAPLADYLAAIGDRPDVQAARRRVAAAHEGVEIAQGARLPSVDLTGNYYFERPDSAAGVDWDVGVGLTVPLYTGGALQSQLREAVSQRTQAELAVAQAVRLAEQEIRAAYQSVRYDRAQLDALATATETARKNYEAQSRDYRLGLVSNLEVLQALTALQQNRRARDRARYALKLDYARLQAAAARGPALGEGTRP